MFKNVQILQTHCPFHWLWGSTQVCRWTYYSKLKASPCIPKINLMKQSCNEICSQSKNRCGLGEEQKILWKVVRYDLWLIWQSCCFQHQMYCGSNTVSEKTLDWKVNNNEKGAGNGTFLNLKNRNFRKLFFEFTNFFQALHLLLCWMTHLIILQGNSFYVNNWGLNLGLMVPINVAQ